MEKPFCGPLAGSFPVQDFLSPDSSSDSSAIAGAIWSTHISRPPLVGKFVPTFPVQGFRHQAWLFFHFPSLLPPHHLLVSTRRKCAPRCKRHKARDLRRCERKPLTRTTLSAIYPLQPARIYHPSTNGAGRPVGLAAALVYIKNTSPTHVDRSTRPRNRLHF